MLNARGSWRSTLRSTSSTFAFSDAGLDCGPFLLRLGCGPCLLRLGAGAIAHLLCVGVGCDDLKAGGRLF